MLVLLPFNAQASRQQMKWQTITWQYIQLLLYAYIVIITLTHNLTYKRVVFSAFHLMFDVEFAWTSFKFSKWDLSIGS